MNNPHAANAVGIAAAEPIRGPLTPIPASEAVTIQPAPAATPAKGDDDVMSQPPAKKS